MGEGRYVISLKASMLFARVHCTLCKQWCDPHRVGVGFAMLDQPEVSDSWSLDHGGRDQIKSMASN